MDKLFLLPFRLMGFDVGSFMNRSLKLMSGCDIIRVGVSGIDTLKHNEQKWVSCRIQQKNRNRRGCLVLTRENVKQISCKISLENGIYKDDLSEDISCIVYRTDVLECGETSIIDRHVDIEYSFGEYYEVQEDTSLFQFICTLCDLPLLQEEKEIILYQQNEE